MIASLLCATVLAQPQDTHKDFTLLLFRSGNNEHEFSADQITEMQNQHIANMGRLYNLKLAHGAGPFGEAGDLRGILILDMPRKDISEQMAQDPFVSGGLLTTDLVTWRLPKDVFARPSAEEFELAEYIFVILTKTDTWSEARADKSALLHERWIETQRSNGAMAAGGRVIGHDSWASVMVFHGNDRDKVTSALKTEPWTKGGYVSSTIKPLYMGKGLFTSPKKS